MEAGRKGYIDYIRVLAIILVIVIHVSSLYYAKFGEADGSVWWMANVLNAASRCAVPLFVMASGAVLLGRREEITEFYRKRAVRLLPAVVFWTLVYMAVAFLRYPDLASFLWYVKADVVGQAQAAFHLWFLNMYLCLMVFAPFLNKIVLGEKLTWEEFRLFLVLVAVFFVLENLAFVAEDVYGFEITWFTLFVWFIPYYLSGHYLDRYGARIGLKPVHLALALAAILSVGALGNYLAAARLGVVKDDFLLGNLSIATFLATPLVFLLVKALVGEGRPNAIVSRIAAGSFGIYLIHPLFLDLYALAFPISFRNGMVQIPLEIAFAGAASYLAVSLMRKVRLLRLVC